MKPWELLPSVIVARPHDEVLAVQDACVSYSVAVHAFSIRSTCLLQLLMVQLCPVPHTAESCAQALAQGRQRILYSRRYDRIYRSGYKTIALHLSQSLSQHLLADSVDQLRQAANSNHSMLCQNLQQKQSPFVRDPADNFFHQAINLGRSTDAIRRLESYLARIFFWGIWVVLGISNLQVRTLPASACFLYDSDSPRVTQ